uniref:Choline transporter-like protein n=1 Tax=Chrysotila carterae TaxID=13221 RepID=A0A7S4B0R5_CHRCT|mmetsp:Transcript_54972/g.119907  ORF Transcript_54972/g.119907 Transcript_54972/m.119907 type:complete len:636 (+) Transcript_54972:305-2212(+)
MRLDEPLVGGPLLANGPETRRCHDVAWLVALLLCWTAMGSLTYLAVSEGDARRLTSGMDYSNHICGTAGTEPGQEDLSDRPFVYFSCLQYGRRHPTVCMSSCPRISGHYVKWYNGSLISCDLHGREIPATTYPTTNLQNNCVPSEASLYAIVSTDIDATTLPSVVAGMQKALTVTLGAAVGASVLAPLWMQVMRVLSPKGSLAMVTVLLAVTSLILLSAALWLRAGYLTSGAFADYSPALQGSLQVATNTDMSVGLALLASALALGVAIGLWCGLLERLLQTGGILREASEAISTLPALQLLLPPLLVALLVLIACYWLVHSVYVASAGTPHHGLLEYDPYAVLYFLFNTLGCLWTSEMVLHLGQCTTAGVIVRWYFGASDLISGRQSGVKPVLASLGRTLRYSSGSVALGSLLVMAGRLFRFFLEHCLHQAQTNSGSKPELRGVAQCCLRCCLDVATKYLQFMSHNAYTLVASHDVSFCEGAKQAFELTLSNIGQVSLLTAGERLLLTLSKLAVACFCTAGAALCLPFAGLGAADNTSGALLLTFMVTFNVADAWICVLDAAVEAIFLCFLVDQAENDGDLLPYYASASLRRYMERHKPTYVLPSMSVEEDEPRTPACEEPEAPSSSKENLRAC